MKRIFILMFCIILLVGTVSAFEWDNVKSYDEVTNQITIKNSLLGIPLDKIADVKLLDNTYYCSIHCEANLEVNLNVDYVNPLKNINIYDLTQTTRREIDSTQLLLRTTSYEIDVPNIIRDCKKGVNEYGACEEIQNGTIKETKWNWEEYNGEDLLAGQYFFKVKGKKQFGDSADWTLSMMGIETTEWANWEAGWNVGLLAYYNFTSVTEQIDPPTNNLIVKTGDPQFLINGSTFVITNNQSGYFNSSTPDGWVINNSFGWNTTNNISFGGWIKKPSTDGGNRVFSKGANGMGFHDSEYIFEDSISTTFLGGATTSFAGFNEWIFFITERNSTSTCIWVNDTLTTCGVARASPENTAFMDLGSTSEDVHVYVDEWFIYNRTLTATEKTDIYDGGTGTSRDLQLSLTTSLVSPANDTNFTIGEVNFEANATPKQISISNMTLFIWYTNNSLFHSNFTNVTGTVENGTSWNITNLGQGRFLWNVFSEGTSGFSDWDINRSFGVDTIPPLINVTSPRETFNFGFVGQNLSLNWTIADTNLNACWFEYNLTNTTLTCGDNNLSFISTIQTNLTVYANDTFGNLNSNFTQWDFRILEINQTFNNLTIEGSTETFNITVLTNETTLTVVNLNYNASIFSGTISNLGDDFYFITRTMSIPNFNEESNVSFFWEFTDSSSFEANSTLNNQTVQVITLDNCGSNTVLIYNYTLRDEENQSIIINNFTEIEINIDFFSEDRSVDILNFSRKYEEINPAQVCLNINLSSTKYSIDSIVKYQETESYVIEYYNIQGFILQNSTIPQDIGLFDLTTPDSTDFQITFKDENFVQVPDALIQIQRQYISENNTFKIVELPKTDANGETIGHFVRNDVVYNLIVIKEGVILGTFNNIIAFCADFTIGDCQISLDALTSSTLTFNYDETTGLVFPNYPLFNSTTNQVTFQFLTVDGSVQTVRLNVTRNDVFGNITICDDVLTTAGGTLACTVPSVGDTLLIATVSTGGDSVLLSNIDIDNVNFGSTGYIVWFFLSLILILMVGETKTGVFIAMFISYLGAVMLGVIERTLFGIGSAGIWIIVITLVGLFKLNKDNRQ